MGPGGGVQCGLQTSQINEYIISVSIKGVSLDDSVGPAELAEQARSRALMIR